MQIRRSPRPLRPTSTIPLSRNGRTASIPLRPGNAALAVDTRPSETATTAIRQTLARLLHPTLVQRGPRDESCAAAQPWSTRNGDALDTSPAPYSWRTANSAEQADTAPAFLPFVNGEASLARHRDSPSSRIVRLSGVSGGGVTAGSRPRIGRCVELVDVDRSAVTAERLPSRGRSGS